MAKTPSNMMPLGTQAPDFNLIDTVSDQMISLADTRSDVATVILFICNHCPYVKHINQALVSIAKHYQAHNIQFIAISSNDVSNYPQDGPELMKQHAADEGYPFPYLYDESQTVAKAYNAACTPDIFIFDGDLKCIYRGQFDDSRPGNDIAVTGKDVCNALDNVLANKPVSEDQKPSIGCSIKWKN